MTEVAKKLGAMWKEINDVEKRKYEELASKDKERYNKEMKSYVKPSSPPKSSKTSSMSSSNNEKLKIKSEEFVDDEDDE